MTEGRRCYRYLEKRDPSRNQHRYYSIMVLPTLFGQWAMIREWGRIGQGGTVRETWYDSEDEALEAGENLCKKKQHRGYRALE